MERGGRGWRGRARDLRSGVWDLKLELRVQGSRPLALNAEMRHCPYT